MCGNSVEEPAHIIRECEAFCAERYDEFGCLEWHSETDWKIDQMMKFLAQPRVKNLEEEQEQDDAE